MRDMFIILHVLWGGVIIPDSGITHRTLYFILVDVGSLGSFYFLLFLSVHYFLILLLKKVIKSL